MCILARFLSLRGLPLSSFSFPYPLFSCFFCLLTTVRNTHRTSLQVHQGYFDIFFPTDFNVMEDMYRAITGKFTSVTTHQDFLERWAYVEDTKTRSGENPLLNWYKNASVMTTL